LWGSQPEVSLRGQLNIEQTGSQGRRTAMSSSFQDAMTWQIAEAVRIELRGENAPAPVTKDCKRRNILYESCCTICNPEEEKKLGLSCAKLRRS
jgi:hypothetical protein